MRNLTRAFVILASLCLLAQQAVTRQDDGAGPSRPAANKPMSALPPAVLNRTPDIWPARDRLSI